MATATALENLVGNMQLAELAERSGRSVSEIVGFALGSKSSPARRTTNASTRAKRNGSPAARSSAHAIDVRTRAGRAEFDAKLLEAINALGTAKASDLENLGGDALQRRAALHRLIASKKIRREGVARSTVYKAR